MRYVEIGITLVNATTCKNMSRHLQTSTEHSVNMWGMMRKTIGLMTSCTKVQEIHIGFKEKYNRKEMLLILIPRVEETSTLAVDSEEEDEVEVWVEFEVK